MAIQHMGERASASEIIAAEVRAELGRQRLSMRQFAVMLGVDKKWVTRRLTSMETNIAVEDVELIARGLNVPVDRFIRVWLAQLPGLDSNQQPAGYTSSSSASPVKRGPKASTGRPALRIVA